MTFDFPDRRRRALELLQSSSQVSAFLVTSHANINWLTGFTGSNGALLLVGERAILATDGRYEDQARREAPALELQIGRDAAAAALGSAVALMVPTVAFESASITVDQLASLEAVGADVAMRLISVTAILEQLRMIKDPAEIEVLSLACEITTAALAEVVPSIRAGMSEVSIARDIEGAMGRAGADDRAFSTIVAAGSNSAVPHHQPTSRLVAVGELLKIDCGARLRGYHADCTRTFVVGAQPAQWQVELHSLVAEAAAAGRAALRAGSAVADVDAAAREIIAAAGFGENFAHGLGHGVGLEIHEAPMLAATAVGTLCAGVVATVEPGVYLVGRGGVRVEDTCVVTSNSAHLLTTAPRDLVQIG